jgi:hypothetical protein
MRGSFLAGLERMQRRSSSRLSLLVLLVGTALLLLSNSPGIDSHEPITTKVRFNKEIVRIFQRHCLACHGSEGLTNVRLSTYATARPWAKAFKEEVLEKRMPPFQAVKGFGNFHNDYTLTQYEIDQLVSWVEGGAPKGDDKDLPSESTSSAWRLGQPDLVLTLKGQRDDLSEEADSYRCLTVPTSLKESRWVRAVDFAPVNHTSVHCAAFAIEPANLQQATGHTVSCRPETETSADRLGIWLPGQTITQAPRNEGRFLPAGARIAIRIHYRKGADLASSPGKLGIYFSKTRLTRPLRTIAIAGNGEEIPAGAVSHRTVVSYTLREPVEAVSIRPLLFPFAKSVEVTAHRPDGTTEVLIWARDYRYDWQPQYDFQRPVVFPKETRLEVVSYLDNSDSNNSNPNNPAQAIRFAATLCELTIVDTKRKRR